MRNMTSRWRSFTLHWWWSGRLWYVHSEGKAKKIIKHKLIGSGQSKLAALDDWQRLTQSPNPEVK